MRFALLILLTTGCFYRETEPTSPYATVCAQALAAHRIVDAQVACDRALEINPRDPDALNNRALVAMEQGDLVEAKRFAVTSLRVRPDSPQGQNTLGAIAVRQGNLRQAAEHFRTALQIAPNFAIPRRNLGDVHLQMKAYADAEKDFRQILLDDPNELEGMLGLAAALEGERRIEDAAGILDRATDAHSTSGEAWLRRARNARARGRLEEAKEAVGRCMLADVVPEECESLRDRLGSD